MREEMVDFTRRVIIYQYSLPCAEHGLPCTTVSNLEDLCYSHSSDADVAALIYNNIIEYAKNEFEIDYDDIDTEFLDALNYNIRFDDDNDMKTKRKYGFFGEVLFYSILYAHLRANVFISKGYFYSPLERSEPKGYDSYHLVQTQDEVELWFGEAKFRVDYTSCIDSVFDNLLKALEEKYFKRNILAIVKEREHITEGQGVVDRLQPIIDRWIQKINFNISDELRELGISLVYPILIAFQQEPNQDYRSAISCCIDRIEQIIVARNINIPPDLNAKLFFIFMPVSDVRLIKESVLQWISERRPLM